MWRGVAPWMGGKGTTDDDGEVARDEARLEATDGALEDDREHGGVEARLDALVDGVDALEDGIESLFLFLVSIIFFGSTRAYPDDLARLRGPFGGIGTTLEAPEAKGIFKLTFS